MTGASPSLDQPITVLQSFGRPHPRTNPYVTLLVESLPGSVRVEYFSWRTGLRGDFDVLHLHWPEVFVRAGSPMRSVARASLFLLLLVRAHLGRRGVVRTLHNLHPHERLHAPQRWLLALCDRWTTAWITLNEAVAPPTDAEARLILHGHYRPWFDRMPDVPAEPCRLLHFGNIRRYKGVDRLLDAFAELDDRHLRLRVVGAVADLELRDRLAAAAGDDRVEVVARHVPDEELADEIHRSELVVLPFSEITNSGSALLTLSLDRPVLLPRTPSTAALAAEVGDGWVHLYDRPLRGADIERALAKVRSTNRTARPNLDRRNWDDIGVAHAAVYDSVRRRAADRRRQRPSRDRAR